MVNYKELKEYSNIVAFELNNNLDVSETQDILNNKCEEIIKENVNKEETEIYKIIIEYLNNYFEEDKNWLKSQQ